MIKLGIYASLCVIIKLTKEIIKETEKNLFSFIHPGKTVLFVAVEEMALSRSMNFTKNLTSRLKKTNRVKRVVVLPIIVYY